MRGEWIVHNRVDTNTIRKRLNEMISKPRVIENPIHNKKGVVLCPYPYLE